MKARRKIAAILAVVAIAFTLCLTGPAAWRSSDGFFGFDLSRSAWPMNDGSSGVNLVIPGEPIQPGSSDSRLGYRVDLRELGRAVQSPPAPGQWEVVGGLDPGRVNSIEPYSAASSFAPAPPEKGNSFVSFGGSAHVGSSGGGGSYGGMSGAFLSPSASDNLDLITPDVDPIEAIAKSLKPASVPEAGQSIAMLFCALAICAMIKRR